MTTPRWVRSLNQPIAISNVIGIVRAAGKHLIRGPERWLPPEKDVCFLPKY